MSETRSPRVVAVDACDVTVLFAARAELSGGLRRFDFVDETQGEDGLWVENWIDRDATLTWQVTVPRAGRYAVAIRYSCTTGRGGSRYEIVAGASRVAGIVQPTSGWSPEFRDWTSFVRDELADPLELSEAVATITLRATPSDSHLQAHEVMRPYTIELIPMRARTHLAAAAQRARGARADTAWFRDAVYGVMFHWGHDDAAAARPAVAVSRRSAEVGRRRAGGHRGGNRRRLRHLHGSAWGALVPGADSGDRGGHGRSHLCP